MSSEYEPESFVFQVGSVGMFTLMTTLTIAGFIGILTPLTAICSYPIAAGVMVLTHRKLVKDGEKYDTELKESVQKIVQLRIAQSIARKSID